MKHLLRYFFVALLAMIGVNVSAQDVTLDFSTNDEWNLPTDYVKTAASYTGTNSGIILSFGESSGGHKINTKDGYLIFGKKDATLTIGSFDYAVERIEIVGREGASGAVVQNIFVGDDAVSTETTGATSTNIYNIAEAYQSAGRFTLKILSAHNTQITKILIWKKGNAPEIITWTVAGTVPLVDKSWDTTDTSADMTSADGENFVYTKEGIVLEQGTEYKFKVAKNHAWTEAYPSSDYVVKVDETATYKIQITFNSTTKEVGFTKEKTGSATEVTHTYGVVGSLVGSWDNDVEMTKGSDGIYRAVITNVAKGNYEFKVRADKAWDISYPGSNYKLTVEQDGSIVTVTFNEETKAVDATVKFIETLTVARALAIIDGLADGAKTDDEYLIKGFVVGTPDFQRKADGSLYGNVNFTIADEKGGTTTLTVFRAKDLDNVNFTEETINRIKEGDAVVLQGKLQKYVKDGVMTPELTNGYLISVNTGGETTLYTITVTNTEHGNITLDKYEAAAGDKVKVLSMTTNEGWQMEPPTITDANGNSVEIKGSDEEGYYFIMPASNVTIALNFVQLFTITIADYDKTMGDVTGITFNSEDNPIYKKAGKNIQFKVTAKDGYTVKSVTAVDEKDNPITVNYPESKEYYEFEMPASNVTIIATFATLAKDVAIVFPEPGDLSAIIDAELNGAKAGNLALLLKEGATYTITKPITVAKSLSIMGEATIDAANLSEPFIVLDGSDEFVEKADGTLSDHYDVSEVVVELVTIKNLQNSLIKDQQKSLLRNLTIVESVIEMPASNKNFIDFNGKGYVEHVIVKYSTIWAKDKNTGFFAQYGSRPKNVNGDFLQIFELVNSTLVNIANGKNMCDLKQNGTAQNYYILNGCLFVDCGKQNQVVVGFNKGQTSATPTWSIYYNAFNWGGADVSAAEAEKAGQKDGKDIVAESMVGTIAFNDAANGDFNGTFTMAEGAEITTRSFGDDSHWTITIAESSTSTAKVWDFTQWSQATIDNLKADAADSKLEGWSDVEKKADAEAGADPTEASKDNCFWSVAEPNEDGELSANGVVIAELKGLKWNKTYSTARSLAIAVNYPSTSLGDYAGPAYLWLGGGKKKVPCFTIPTVTAGSTIEMKVESHKSTEGRGIELYTGVDADNLVDAATKIGDSFNPTTVDTHTWTVDNDCDVIVYNTNGCHIYTITVTPGVPTGISVVETAKTQDNVIYNLAGQKVGKDYKGIVIMNGRKFMQK